jgi:hypothetical protein
MLSAISLTWLSGWFTNSAAEDAEQLLKEQSIAVVLSELGGRVHASWLSSGTAALTSCLVWTIRAHTWHIWRMLFNWMKWLTSYTGESIKFWILFGWVTALNARYWESALKKELRHCLLHAISILAETEDGEVHQLLLDEDDVCKAGVCAAAYAPARTAVDTDYGIDEPIIDSGCGQSIYPKSWLQRMGEKFKLRPANLQLRAANGGKMGMLGVTAMKFRIPGTQEWIEHDVMIADHGAVPNHVHILGNDFLRKIRASLSWGSSSLSGITPGGEEFSVPVKMGGVTKPTWCHAVELEMVDSGDTESVGAALLMGTHVIAPGDSMKVEAMIYGVPEEEQDHMWWEPTAMQLGDGTGTKLTSEAIMAAEEGIVAFVATNRTSEELTLAAGMRVATVEGCERVNTEELLGNLQSPGKDWRNHSVAVWTALLGAAWCLPSKMMLAMTAAVPLISLIAAFSLAVLSITVRTPTLCNWVHSIHHDAEDNDPNNSRQTTTRHRAKTRLDSSDPRAMESGNTTVERMKQALRKQKKLKREYELWLGEVAQKFTFGEGLTDEEKDDLTTLLFAYRELFIKNTGAPPAIDGIEYALYFRENDPMPVRCPIPRLSPLQLEHMDKQISELLKNYMIQFSDSDWATRPVFAKKKDGGLRLAIDYRRLNQSLLHDSMPLPNIPDTLESLGKASRYSAWDACAGFWGIRIRPKDRKYTAFHARFQGAWHLME